MKRSSAVRRRCSYHHRRTLFRRSSPDRTRDINLIAAATQCPPSSGRRAAVGRTHYVERLVNDERHCERGRRRHFGDDRRDVQQTVVVTAAGVDTPPSRSRKTVIGFFFSFFFSFSLLSTFSVGSVGAALPDDEMRERGEKKTPPPERKRKTRDENRDVTAVGPAVAGRSELRSRQWIKPRRCRKSDGDRRVNPAVSPAGVPRVVSRGIDIVIWSTEQGIMYDVTCRRRSRYGVR